MLRGWLTLCKIAHYRSAPSCPCTSSAYSALSGFEERTLLVGHSFGGWCWTIDTQVYKPYTTWSEIHDPRLFSCSSTQSSSAPYLTQKRVARLDSWPSRSALPRAHKSNVSSTRAFSPRTSRTVSSRPRRPPPACSSRCCVCRRRSSPRARTRAAEVWGRLPALEERVELCFVVPGREGAPELGEPGSTAERVWRRPENASNVRVPKCGASHRAGGAAGFSTRNFAVCR
ncbi:hypothetical protein C8J57DRAFT_656895 [Mycena rebaudengoi]|nr:hypothetical protein C8J57DRAFT_656895 [Mycena rebaudengoi]